MNESFFNKKDKNEKISYINRFIEESDEKQKELEKLLNGLNKKNNITG